MRIFAQLSILAVCFPAFGQVNITNVPPATAIQPSDYVLGTSNNVAVRIPVSLIQAGLSFAPQLGALNTTNWAQFATNVLGTFALPADVNSSTNLSEARLTTKITAATNDLHTTVEADILNATNGLNTALGAVDATKAGTNDLRALRETNTANVFGGTFFGDASQVFLGANTNVSISNITSVIKVTNQFWNAYNVVFSNSVLDVAGEPQPVLWPFGGEYVGLHITNSPTIAATHEQACIGFPLSTQFPTPGTAKNIFVRDSIFWADGLESDAASFKTSLTTGASTNNYYFWNDLFHAQKYGFNQVGYGNYNFYNCLFDAAVGFLPDQGPNTNRLQGCLFNVVQGTLDVGAGSAGSGAAGLLIQLRSRTTVVGGQMNIITTNAAGDSTGIAWSAEGDYYAIIKNMHFHLAGPGTNCISDFAWAGSAGAANCLLVLDDVTYDGANSAGGGWLVNNSVSPSPTIIVMGGNLSPTNFTDPSSVTFLTPFQAGTNIWTGSNFWSAATNKFSGAVIANRFIGDGSALTGVPGGSAPTAGTNISVSGSAVSLQRDLTNLNSIVSAKGYFAGIQSTGTGPTTLYGSVGLTNYEDISTLGVLFSNVFGILINNKGMYFSNNSAAVALTYDATAGTLTTVGGFGGPGSGLTSLPANQLSSGTVPAARLGNWNLTSVATAATLTAGADNLTYTGPSTSQTLVGRTSTDTLQNKAFDATDTGYQDTNLVLSIQQDFTATSQQTNFTIPLLPGAGGKTITIYGRNTNFFLSFTGTNNAGWSRTVIFNCESNTPVSSIKFQQTVLTNANFLPFITNGWWGIANFYNPDAQGTNLMVSWTGLYHH